MSFRTVVITKRSKLDYKMDYLVVRTEDTISRIHLSEISILMIESTAVSMTAYLLAELAKHKIKVILCDNNYNPYGELCSLYGSHDTSRKVRQQIRWTEEAKKFVWAEIVRWKLLGQIANLPADTEAAEKIASYLPEILPGDPTNREAHAAKVYFNALFGMDFSRSGEDPVNAALNYGYSILLSAFNREIVSCGYLTQLGIFHDNMFNHFNLSSDLMEPFRPFVDRIVVEIAPEKLEHTEKMQLVNILNQSVRIQEQQHFLINAIHLYTLSVFEALTEQDISKLRFPSFP